MPKEIPAPSKRGGSRKGAGRKSLPDDQRRNRRVFWLTNDEFEQLTAHLKSIRES